MSTKIGRNDPCPCGSGKKYKHCCGMVAPPVAPETAHDGGVERALDWLATHHRKAFAAALQQAIDDAVNAAFDDEFEAAEAMAGIDAELREQIQLNLTEWLLAEGEMLVKGEQQNISGLLLGPSGPHWNPGQRDWLQQLAQRPLRLYDVTEVVAGESVTVCDALDREAPPQRVTERTASRAMKAGMRLGARLMTVVIGGEQQQQFSGAMYPFGMFSGRTMLDRLREVAKFVTPDAEDQRRMIGLAIVNGWMEQFLLPAPAPELIYSPTGEPLRFITDHYAVQDWDALGASLAAQPDVEGDRQAGWSRLHEGTDGVTRPQVRIEVESGGKRLSVQYQTDSLAAQGRAWFDALAGAAVKFVRRKVSDARDLIASAAAKPSKRGAARPPALDPETLSAALGEYIHRTYANWADEPIPMLDGQTPRQAIATPAGLERVKGLLRSYEDGEAEQAAQQGRPQVSYQFLWDALGLRR